MTRHHTTIGIEIEYRGGFRSPLAEIRRHPKSSLANIVDEHWAYNTTFHDDRWVLGCDGSVDYEIKSHPLRDTAEIKHVMAGIRAGGGSVDRNCGTHIHVGIAHLTVDEIRRLAKLWLRYEKALDDLHPQSRRRSNGRVYTRSNYDTFGLSDPRAGDDLTACFSLLDACATVGEISAQMQHSRGVKFNLYPYAGKSTVEFRGHAGTLNFKKIDAWISIVTALTRMAASSCDIDPSIAYWNEALDEIMPFCRTDVQPPRPGTKTRRVWDEADAVLLERSDLTTVRAGRRVLTNQKVLGDIISARTALNIATIRRQLVNWTQARDLSSRVTNNLGALRRWLDARADRLGHDCALAAPEPTPEPTPEPCPVCNGEEHPSGGPECPRCGGVGSDAASGAITF